MKPVRTIAAIACLVVVSACQREASVDEVPVGSDVQLTRADGALVEGKLLDRDAAAVKVDVGPATRSVPREDIAGIRVKTADAPPPKRATFREITLPADTRLAVRLDATVSSVTARVEDPVRGELDEPIVKDGQTLIPAGAIVTGVVAGARPSGKVKGRASLSLAFNQLSVGKDRYGIDARFARTAPATKTKDAEKIGIPAAGAAAIGAIIGGKKGAAIGAAAGAGAGTAVVLSTPGKNVVLDGGTVLSLTAGRTFTVRVPLD